MRYLYALCLFCTVTLVSAAESNVTLTIPIINQSSHALKSQKQFEFITVTSDYDKPIQPYTLLLNMDPYNVPVSGKLVISKPKNFEFQFQLNFFTSDTFVNLCQFQVRSSNQNQEDVSLIEESSNAPVKCSYSIDKTTQLPTIVIQDNN